MSDAKEAWIETKIYGIDLYENFTPRVMIPGDSEEAIGPIDEVFGEDEFIVSPSVALANGKFYGVALVKGDEKEGVIYVRGERVGMVGKAGTSLSEPENESVSILDKAGNVCSRFVDSREKAMRWAERQSEAGSLVLKKRDLQDDDVKNQQILRKDLESYKMRRTVLDTVNSMHHTDRPKP